MFVCIWSLSSSPIQQKDSPECRNLILTMHQTVFLLIGLLVYVGASCPGSPETLAPCDCIQNADRAYVTCNQGSEDEVWTAITNIDRTTADIYLITVENVDLTRIPAGTFDGLKVKAVVIRDSQTDVTVDHTAFRGVIGMEMLELDNLGIRALTKGAFVAQGLSSLTCLHITNNNINTIWDYTFYGLTSLKDLWLSNNNIASLQVGGLNGLSALKHLDLSFNALQYIQPNTFLSVSTLETLRLDNNVLSTFSPETFNGLGLITGLDLTNNRISYIASGAFHIMPNVQELSFSNNRLASLGANVFDGAAGVSRVNFSGNQMTYVAPKALSGLPQLSAVSFSHNQLTTLAEDVIDESNSKIHFNMNDNPLVCDCALTWILDDSAYTCSGACAQPPHLDGRELNTLTDGEVCNNPV